MPIEIAGADAAIRNIEEATRSNVEKIAAIEESHRLRRSRAERVAAVITEFCGSMTFVYVHVVFFGGWIIWNVAFEPFDPFPFTFLTLVVSLEAIFLSTFILITQNQETRLTERRNHLDLQINLLAEQENTRMLEILQGIAQKLDVPYDDEKVQELLEDIEPGKLADQIISGAEKSTDGIVISQ